MAETQAIAEGYQRRLDERAENFRRLFMVMHNANFKPPLTAEQLWPLSTDKAAVQPLSEDEMYARNKEIERQIFERHNKN